MPSATKNKYCGGEPGTLGYHKCPPCPKKSIDLNKRCSALSEQGKCLDPCCPPCKELDPSNIDSYSVYNASKKQCYCRNSSALCSDNAAAGNSPLAQCSQKKNFGEIASAHQNASSAAAYQRLNQGENDKYSKKMGMARRKEPFQGMDPMASNFGVVSYGENYSLVAFGLFTILMILYKQQNKH